LFYRILKMMGNLVRPMSDETFFDWCARNGYNPRFWGMTGIGHNLWLVYIREDKAKTEELINKIVSERLERYNEKNVVVFCPFCNVELVQEESYIICPKCKARYYITLDEQPITLGGNNK